MRQTTYLSYIGPINEESVKQICQAFNHAVETGCGAVHFVLQSGGGNIDSGIFLYSYLKSLPINVTVHNIGDVSSIAVVVYVAGKTRLCSKFSSFLLHPSTYNTGGPMPVAALQGNLDALIAKDSRINSILNAETSLSKEALDARTLYDLTIDAFGAVQNGIAHKIEEFHLPAGKELIQI